MRLVLNITSIQFRSGISEGVAVIRNMTRDIQDKGPTRDKRSDLQHFLPEAVQSEI